MKERAVEAEALRTLRQYGLAYQTVDATRCQECGSLIYPRAAPGKFDITAYIPDWDRRVLVRYAIEVKVGRTAIPFKFMDKKKRLWQDGHSDEFQMWLWFCVGRDIRDEKYRRKVWLFPYSEFIRLEQEIAPRKSIPYSCPELDRYELVWLGKGMWKIPENHPFWR